MTITVGWIGSRQANIRAACMVSANRWELPNFCRALPKEPRFCTFREVAYARFGRQFHVGPWLGKTFFRPTVEVGILYVRIRYGLNMYSASPEQAVEGIRIPVLLIHGLSDRNIPPYHSDRIQSHNPLDVTVWKVPGAVHSGAQKRAPEEFERRVPGWCSKARHTYQERNPGG
jgi:pimeloyl-ACP methyl ester carboxylesterase